MIERTKFLENLRLEEILSVKHYLNPQKNQEVIFPKRGVSQSLDYVYSLHPMPPSTNTIRELPFEAAEDQFSNNNPAFNVCAVRFYFRSIFLNCELTRWGQVEDRDQDQGWSSPGLHHQLPEPGDYFPLFCLLLTFNMIARCPWPPTTSVWLPTMSLGYQRLAPRRKR